MFHDQTAPALNSLPITSSATQHFPTSVLIKEHRDDNKPLLQIIKEDETSQVRDSSDIYSLLHYFWGIFSHYHV